MRDDELPLTRWIIELACMYGRYGCRHITALLHAELCIIDLDPRVDIGDLVESEFFSSACS